MWRQGNNVTVAYAIITVAYLPSYTREVVGRELVALVMVGHVAHQVTVDKVTLAGLSLQLDWMPAGMQGEAW